MAQSKSRKNARVVEVDPEDVIDVPDEMTPGDVELMQLINTLEAGEDVSVHIYRQGTSFKDLTLLAEVAPADFKPIMLAYWPYMGGVFRIHVRGSGGIMKNKELRVARAPDAKEPPKETEAATSQQGMQDFSTLLLQMQRDSDARMERMIEAMKANQAAPVDPLAIMERVSAVMKNLAPPAVAVAPVAPPTLESQISTLMKVREFGEMMGGNSGKSETGEILGMAKDLIGVAAAQRASVGNMPAPPQDNEMSEGEQEMFAMQILFKAQLKKGIKLASTGGDPAQFADTIYDFLPEDDVKTMAGDPQWFEKMCTLVPECAPHQAWFAEVRKTLISFAIDDDILPKPAESVTSLNDDITEPPAV